MIIEYPWAFHVVMLIILESEACLDAAAVLYLYPARHTQADPVFRGKPILTALTSEQLMSFQGGGTQRHC